MESTTETPLKDLDVSAKTLEKLLSKRAKLEEVRAALLSSLEETETEIKEVEAEYGAVYNKASKVLKLPPEVTCMIFDYAASGYLNEDMKEGAKTRHRATRLLPEVVVSHVCRYWRAVSLSYPRLWTSFRYDGALNEALPADRFKAYLERSTNLDLELWLDFSLVLPDDSDRETNVSMLRLAVAYAPRWKRVTMMMLDQESQILDEIAHQLKALCVPKLEHFTLCSDGDTDMNRRVRALLVDIETTILKGGAPNLQSLHLDGATYFECSPPMTNLTALRIEADAGVPRYAYNRNTFLSILRLPSLEHLSLVGNIFDLQDLSVLDTIEMNKLKSLRFSDDNAMCLVLTYIRAPLLDMLTMQGVWLPGGFDFLSSLRLESYFFPSLRRLNLLDVSSTTLAPARSLISLTETAKEIMFADNESEDSMLFLIPEIYSDTPFWPKLEKLFLNTDLEEEIEPICHLLSMHGPPQATEKKPTVFVPSKMKEIWKVTNEEDYRMLVRLCNTEVLQPKGFGASTWPPSQDRSSYQFWEKEDPFDIDEF